MPAFLVLAIDFRITYVTQKKRIIAKKKGIFKVVTNFLSKYYQQIIAENTQIQGKPSSHSFFKK